MGVARLSTLGHVGWAKEESFEIFPLSPIIFSQFPQFLLNLVIRVGGFHF